ncbi:OadG family protein [Propionivibrio sp.]|uniref:OadG family protein n=1 Tax=Propionivibrio sp. TaxID=2212460 RepID=UPI003BF141DD
MLSLAAIKALQIYGLAIVISMLVAVLIKVMVVATSRAKPVSKVAAVAQKTAAPVTVGIPAEVVAAISAAISVITGPHHILHIGESKRNWANEGRIAQHSHQPRH